VLAFNEVDYERTHSIGYLTSLLEHHGVDLPDRREQIEELTPWAVAARYEDRFDEVLDRAAVRELVSILRGWSERQLSDEPDEETASGSDEQTASGA